MHVIDPTPPPSAAPTVVAPPSPGGAAPSAPSVVAPSAPVPPPAIAVAASGADPVRPYDQCDECGAPVDTDQRYCVVCGAHRRHVQDPAARYLSQATARVRSSRSAAGTSGARRPARGRSVGAALVLAVIPVAAAVGVGVGRSSNSDDDRLIQALAHRQAAAVSSASAPSSSSTATRAASRATATGHSATNARRRHRKGTTSSTHKGAKAVSSTQFGTVTQIAGSKPTKAQEQQGAQATQKVQKSTGKTYVNQQSNLPGTVVVP